MAKGSSEPYVPSDSEKVGSLSDVAYEIEQLTRLLSVPSPPPGAASNARTESTLLHVRQLLDFFEHDTRRAYRGKENDDVLSLDYDFVPRPVVIDSTWRLRLNKDLAHLSYSRQLRLGSDKQWNMQNLGSLIERCRDFAAHVVETWAPRLDSDQSQRWRALHVYLGGS